jgi:hypothetical protein
MSSRVTSAKDVEFEVGLTLTVKVTVWRYPNGKMDISNLAVQGEGMPGLVLVLNEAQKDAIYRIAGEMFADQERVQDD